MPGLSSLYEGAALGPTYSQKLGQFQAESEATYGDVRANLLQTGVATGKINPASLSSEDAALLGSTGVPHVTAAQHSGGGFFGDVGSALGDVFGTPLKIVLNTAGDFASAVEGIPQGVATLGQAVWNTASGAGNAIAGATGGGTFKASGPNLGDVGKAVAQQTLRDFTNFDPMHPLYPALDLATLVSGGASALARGGGALARLGEVGRAGEVAGEAGTAGRVARVGQAMTRLAAPGERPALQLGGVDTGITPGAYSISPFRRLILEHPIDAFYNSKIANMQVPGRPEGWTWQDERAVYHVRKIANITSGRVSATGVGEAARATQPFNEAMHALRSESANDAQAADKFNALVLRRMLGADGLEASDALDRLDQYRDRVLAKPLPGMEGVAARTEQADRIRDYYRRLTAQSEYRSFFSNPSESMLRVRQAWDNAIMAGMHKLGLDPQEVLNRSLGPAAYIREMTPEELLREQPQLVQMQTNFAIVANRVEKALKEAGGGGVMEERLATQMAQQLPVGKGINPALKLQLVRDAIDSLKEDIQNVHSRRDLTNNAHATGYLPGNTLAQKVASGLVDRLGVDSQIAEPFAVGGLTNYFPTASALHLKITTQGGRIARAMERLPGVNSGASRLGLHEFRREPMLRLLRAQSLGVAPFGDFLHEADLEHFKAGLDRRDPLTFVRHIAERERLLAHRKLAEPLIARMAMKDADGKILTFKTPQALAEHIGNVNSADRWRLLPHQAIQSLVQFESEAGKDVARVLKESDGKVTPEVSDQIDSIIDQNAQMFTRQLADSVIANGDGMIAVPKPYVDNLIRHAAIIDSAKGPGRLWQGFINRWRTAVLAYMPSWLVRTSIGHGTILFIGGTWNPVHYLQASTYFGDGFKLPGSDTHLLRGAERDVPPGVEQGTPHEDFGRFGMQRLSTGRLAQLTTHGVHRIMNFQRRAAFISLMNRTVHQRWSELEDAMKLPENTRFHVLTTKGMDYVIENHPELVHHVLNELDRVSYTFGQMAPWERRLAKNFIPFWGWYKFVNKFVWSLPLTYPGRALALTRLGQLGASEQGQLVGPMPEWLRSSLLFDTHNLAAVHYLSMLGLNPLGDIADPAHGFQGLVRLGQMSPVIQAGLEGAGYNTLTGGLETIDPSSGIIEVNGQYYNVLTGQPYESLDQASPTAGIERAVGGLMRAFPEIRIAEPFFTGGRPTYPESIPFIQEHPIPSATPKPTDALHTMLQYFGVAPRTYNLQKWQTNLDKNMRRSEGIYRRDVAKERALK